MTSWGCFNPTRLTLTKFSACFPLTCLLQTARPRLVSQRDVPPAPPASSSSSDSADKAKQPQPLVAIEGFCAFYNTTPKVKGAATATHSSCLP